MNIQFLDKDQTNNILTVIRRDYVAPTVNKKLQEVRESEDFKKVFDNILNSDETKKKIEKVNTQYENDVKVKALYDQIRAIGKEYVYSKEYWELSYAAQEDTTFEYLDHIKENGLKQIELSAKRKAENLLKLNRDYQIESNIMTDIKARIVLLSVDTFETIVNELVKYIDVDKYLYDVTIVDEDETDIEF